MTKHDKEIQRYAVKWVMVALLVIIIFTGLYGYLNEVKDHSVILIMLGEVVTLLALFFGFNMKTSVSQDEISHEIQ